jgi:hypothetical protein
MSLNTKIEVYKEDEEVGEPKAGCVIEKGTRSIVLA